MAKVAINKCFGGFDLSDEAYKRLGQLGIPIVAYDPDKHDRDESLVIYDSELGGHKPIGGRYWDSWTRADEYRTNPLLIQMIEELGERASGQFGQIVVVEVPDDTEWEIDEYDGLEHIAEKHRTWG